MTVKQIQWALASVFFILGGWALLAPRSVIALTLLPEYRPGPDAQGAAAILPFAIACFGAQAMISGLFAAFSRFTRTTFLAYGIALLPFFRVQLVVHLRRPGVHLGGLGGRRGQCRDADAVRGGVAQSGGGAARGLRANARAGSAGAVGDRDRNGWHCPARAAKAGWMIRPFATLASCLLLAGCGDSASDSATVPANTFEPASAAPKASEPLPDSVRVRLETEAGAIVFALDARRAPITTANFVRYVDAGRFDGTNFYRASRTRGAAGRGFIQGGIRRNARLMFPAIVHEPTSETGIKHGEGTISMARAETGAGAIGDFFITAAATPTLDAREGSPGYAAFGRVVEGMDVVRRILAAPTVANAGRGAMRGQLLTEPVGIVRARRVE